jgi:septal ring factor EnvC (AmiA/AmiB activator)
MICNIPTLKNSYSGKLIFTLLVTLFFSIFSLELHAQTREELEKKRKEILEEISELQQTQSTITKDKKASLSQLKLIENKLRKRYAFIDNLNDDMRLIDNTIFSNNREIYRLQKQLDTLRIQYAKTIEYAYKNRSNYDMMNFIFTASNFNDAIRRISYLKSYRRYRDEQSENIVKTSKVLKSKIETLTLNKNEKGKVLVEQNKQKAILEVEKKEKNQFVSKLKAREKEIEKEMIAKRKVERSLQSAIAAIVKREIEAARKKAEEEARKLATKTEVEKTAIANSKPISTRKSNVLENTPEVTKVSVGFENNRGNLPWPVDKASVVAGFGKQKIEGTSLVEDNIGLTIQTNPGTNVKAVFEGVVTSIYDVAGSQTITIKHGKYFTTYYNLSVVNVSKGNIVQMGQVIGKAGVNDDGEGEIMFVVNIESTFVNPEIWLKNK